MDKKVFIDLFAGCGGLSLGLTNAGWQGLFAVERTADAFKTLKHNLIDKNTVTPFKWPEWLPQKEMTTSEILDNYKEQLANLKGTVDLIAGGPPCQGFSFAGRRNPNDPRNKLTEQYIEIVKLVQPKYLLLENVKGFKSPFKGSGSDIAKNKVYAEVVKDKLEEIDYKVFYKVIQASKFGVPQPRPRFIMIAIKDGEKIEKSPFDLIEEFLPEYRKSKGLKEVGEISVKEAISDLEITGRELIDCEDTKNFKQVKYSAESLTTYQQLMRSGVQDKYSPNSLRLPKHKTSTRLRFEKVIDNPDKYKKGTSLPKAQMVSLGTNKRSFTPLHPDHHACTITTLPDDLLHYSEPRILTVRENARIQSFPDWFEFQGKYTTGGPKRKEECPRYTQVGNAVPPLMAEALGKIIDKLNNE
ncbi:DNA (cytosine-5)-methyltransferase 1 [Methylobacillus rhizosphaerae]|uniref:Cytosine-specific methyltransferase n=1 Tax=Methylobacillus rhizosphaerae TaxID=551994 RepID=A0A239B7E7_9PROT|nr:DNA cytosine methyltransferase [Methylobacillus rhizosphaerae]SNS03238.1 DNA (cytosine-5)-methyltransferase 1 [Methylobacillus rhizosphaerae]